jgi:hypothetical protein
VRRLLVAAGLLGALLGLFGCSGRSTGDQAAAATAVLKEQASGISGATVLEAKIGFGGPLPEPTVHLQLQTASTDPDELRRILTGGYHAAVAAIDTMERPQGFADVVLLDGDRKLHEGKELGLSTNTPTANEVREKLR